MAKKSNKTNNTVEEVKNVVQETQNTEIKADETIIENEVTIVETVEAIITEVETVIPIKAVKQKEVKTKTAKEHFLEATAKTPFTILQNGVRICSSSPYIDIIAEEKYFEIASKKYSYSGIEVKH